VSEEHTIVSGMIEAYRVAVFNRDIEALMRLYDPSVRVFDTWDVWSYEGADAWRASVHAWLSTLGDDRVRVTVEDVQVLGESPLLVTSAVFRYAAIDGSGQELRALQNRLTWALRFDGETWKIVHEHTSMPVGHEDGRGMFVRPSGD